MTLKGSQRGGARQMALHLLNGEKNEHVKVHQVRGFISDNVVGVFNEIYAISTRGPTFIQLRAWIYHVNNVMFSS